MIPAVAVVVVGVFAGAFGAVLNPGEAWTETYSTIMMPVTLVIMAAYIATALVLFCRGTTPGKHLLHLRVVKQDDRDAGFLTMLGREWIGKALSGMLFGLGYIWILIDRDHQGWHDKLVATYVVEA